MIKKHIKLRFATEADANAVTMVAEKSGQTVEQLVHSLLHKAVLDHYREREAINEVARQVFKTDKV